jgi:hypothetical protein
MSGIRGGKLYIGEDAIVYWGDRDDPGTGLYDNNLRSFVNDATVAFTLYQSDGTTAVSGGAGTCSYVTGSQGCYEGVLEDGVTLVSGTTYVLEILATGSGDRIGRRRIQYTAQYHAAD